MSVWLYSSRLRMWFPSILCKRRIVVSDMFNALNSVKGSAASRTVTFTMTSVMPSLYIDASAASRSILNRFMSAPPGNGCVGASILPREVVGTHFKEVTHG